MQDAVAVRKIQAVGIDESAIKIQRCVRKMLNRIHFRNNLYRLILMKSLVENKVHKEKMAQLYAFE
jgi:hypothetical protein